MPPRKLFTAKLSDHTAQQIAELAEAGNTTKTQVVTVAVEQMYMASRPIYIYALCDPGTSNVRYIGKTVNPKTRLAVHIFRKNPTVNGMNPCARWLAELRERGARPDMLILEETTEQEWEAKEQEWIKRLIDEGIDLLNVTNGGLSGKWRKTYQAWDEPPTDV